MKNKKKKPYSEIQTNYIVPNDLKDLIETEKILEDCLDLLSDDELIEISKYNNIGMKAKKILIKRIKNKTFYIK